jgi:hypothetical protein
MNKVQDQNATNSADCVSDAYYDRTQMREGQQKQANFWSAIRSGAVGISLHLTVAIALWIHWPPDYDADWFNTTASFLVVHSWKALLLAFVYCWGSRDWNPEGFWRLQPIFLLWNFAFGVTAEAVDRHFAPETYLYNRQWNLPNLSAWEWWYDAVDYMPLLFVATVSTGAYVRRCMAERARS